MNLYILSCFLAFFVNGSLAFYGLLLNPRGKVNRIFATAFLSVIIWNLSEAVMRVSPNYDQALVWARIMYVAVFFIPSSMLHFSLVFTKNPFLEKPFHTFLVYVPAIIFLPTTFTPYIVSDVAMTPFGYDIISDSLFGIFSFVFLFICLCALYVFLKRFISTPFKSEKSTLLVILLGCSIPLLLGSFTNLLSRVWGMEVPRLGTLFSALISFSFVYAIRRHRFLVMPSYERKEDGLPSFTLERGNGYLIKEEQPERSYRIFKDIVSHGVSGIVIARTPPAKVRKMMGLEKTPVFWLSSISGENTLGPQDLSKIIFLISSFLKESQDSIVFIEGIEYLIYNNSFESVLKFLHSLNDAVVLNNSRLLLSVNPKTISQREIALVEKELMLL